MTRQSKPFGPELRDGYIDDTTIRDLAEMKHSQQAWVLVMAPTKAVTIERLTAVGLGWIATPHYLRVQIGIPLGLLRDGGYLQDDGSVILYHRSVDGCPVIQLSPGADVVVARWKYDRASSAMTLVRVHHDISEA